MLTCYFGKYRLTLGTLQLLHVNRGSWRREQGSHVRNPHKVRIWRGWSAEVAVQVLKADWRVLVKGAHLHRPERLRSRPIAS